jgi:predicted RNA-binding Zn-ribbon protein involved in translation (DUF1610 family)
VYVGNLVGHPSESTYCPGCGKKVIHRIGYRIMSVELDETGRCQHCQYQIPAYGTQHKFKRNEKNQGNRLTNRILCLYSNKRNNTQDEKSGFSKKPGFWF